ncbi:MAG: AAA family ATPase [Bacteroidales bacterium]|nr:AAA family ATPase [Bacteroidales bacterium]
MKVTVKNLSEIYPTLDQSILPKSVQQDEYDFIEGILDSYGDDETFTKLADRFCERLTKALEATSSGNNKTSRKVTKATPNANPQKAVVPKKPIKIIEKLTKKKTKKTTKSVKEKVEKPKPKAVEKIPADVAIIKRYVNLHKKDKTKKQILDFIKAIQKAIAEKVLRKSDKYAEQIQNIQKQLTKCYRNMSNWVLIELDKKTLEQYKAIVNSVVVSDSVKLFKSFLKWMSAPDKDSATLILTKCQCPTTDLEKSVVRTLKTYIKNGEYDISEQELNGICDAVGVSGLGEVDDDDDNDFSDYQKKKNAQNAGIVNSEDFARMQFDTLKLTGDYQKIIGTPSTNFVAMVFGCPGSGKTTFCLKLAEYLCKNHDKNVLFSTIEEGINHTFQEKLKRMQAIHPNLSIADFLPDDLEQFDVVILDSVNTFGFDSKKLRSLCDVYPDKIFIWIFQTTKNGVFRGSQEYQHDCDVVIEVKNGVATTENHKNRFGANGIFEIF